MTPAELKAEIESGPLAAQLAPLVESGNDAGVAELLNAPAYPGVIPRSHLAATLFQFSDVLAVVLYREGADGAKIEPAFNGPVAAIQLALSSQADLSIPVGVITDYLTKLASIVTDAGPFQEALLAGEVKRSRVQFLFGQSVSINDISAALRGK